MSQTPSKKELRKIGIAARNGVSSADRPRFDRNICGAIMRSDAFCAASVVMLYRAMPGETDVAALSVFSLAAGKRIAYPYCADKTTLYALEPSAPDAWKKGAYGILSPDPAHSNLVSPGDVDLIILPCTAYDGQKNRLGMGGGYYDRFLPACKHAVAIIAAYSAQRVERIPAEAHDVPADFVATENGIF